MIRMTKDYGPPSEGETAYNGYGGFRGYVDFGGVIIDAPPGVDTRIIDTYGYGQYGHGACACPPGGAMRGYGRFGAIVDAEMNQEGASLLTTESFAPERPKIGLLGLLAVTLGSFYVLKKLVRR